MSESRERLASWIVAFLCCALLAAAMTAAEAQQGSVDLVLPRAALAREAVWLQVRAGGLPRGAVMRIRTRDGELLGTVSPFGKGQDGTAYTIPLPATAVAGGRAQLRLEVEEPGGAARAPKAGEVESVDLIYVPVSN